MRNLVRYRCIANIEVAINLDLWVRALGRFAAELEGSSLVTIVEAIKQMTKLHRNPLVHPEVI